MPVTVRIVEAGPPSGDGLPPDPGEAGKATLEGIDSDGDGVRDDVERYIVLTYPDSEKTRAGLTQYAKAMQLVITEDVQAVDINIPLQLDAADCLWYVLGSSNAIDIKDHLKAQFLNTEDRSRAYARANTARSGTTRAARSEGEFKSKCNFDPDAMDN